MTARTAPMAIAAIAPLESPALGMVDAVGGMDVVVLRRLVWDVFADVMALERLLWDDVVANVECEAKLLERLVEDTSDVVVEGYISARTEALPSQRT